MWVHATVPVFLSKVSWSRLCRPSSCSASSSPPLSAIRAYSCTTLFFKLSRARIRRSFANMSDTVGISRPDSSVLVILSCFFSIFLWQTGNLCCSVKQSKAELLATFTPTGSSAVVQTDGQTGRRLDIHADTWAGRQKDRQTNKQTDMWRRQASRQTDRHSSQQIETSKQSSTRLTTYTCTK